MPAALRVLGAPSIRVPPARRKTGMFYAPGYSSFAFAHACRQLGIRLLRTRSTRPAPTAKPNASSRPPCAIGPMPVCT